MTEQGPANAGPAAPAPQALPKPLVELRGVTKRFGELYAVDDVTLAIYPGEFFSLLGPSGCGKTTLLRMLGGFERPDAGSILIDGEEMNGVPPYRRPVNMMFQSYALFPHMSVEQNVAFGLRQERLGKTTIRDRVAEMLELVQLTQFGHRKPHQISGGQRQRVALARALARQPKLLLLDEPLAALDKKLREHTQFELMDIQDKTGTTFIVVTHDQEEAMILSNRIAVMDKGQVKQVGTPTQIYEYPQSKFVAGFIGSITSFDARVKSGAGETAVVEVPQMGADITARAIPGLAEGQAITLAVRPEKIAIGRERPDGPNAVRGTVDDFGYLGKDSIYKVKLDSGTILSVHSVNSRRGTEHERVAAWEDSVWLSFDPNSAILLAE